MHVTLLMAKALQQALGMTVADAQAARVSDPALGQPGDCNLCS